MAKKYVDMDAYKAQEVSQMSSVAELEAVYDTPFKRASIARAGVNALFVEDLMHLMDLKKQETAMLIDISPKTLDRHIKLRKPFKGLQSDRILELADLYQQGHKVFGSDHKFLKWLDSNIAALNNTKPKEWLDTQQGIKAIMNELGRIQHGIFA